MFAAIWNFVVWVASILVVTPAPGGGGIMVTAACPF